MQTENTIIDERTGWKYELVGDYYLPIEMPMDKALERMPERRACRAAVAMKAILEANTHLPAEEETSGRIGHFGRAHAAYLKRTQINVFSQLVAEGRLGSYLSQLDEQAHSMLYLLIRQMAEREGVTKQLKAADQMAWVRRMNSFKNRAEEIVNRDLICA